MQFKPLTQTDFPSHTVAYTVAVGNTATWNPGPEYALVWVDTASYIEVGVGAVASAASTPIPANIPVLIRVPIGTRAPWRVSALPITAITVCNVYAKPVQGA